MNAKNKKSLKNIVLTGSIVAGSVIGLGSLNANATETFKYSELGSGGELRTSLLNQYSNDFVALEMSCGESTKESKSKEAKCGEGKCGEKKKDAKAVKADKSSEGGCGDDKSDKKSKKAEKAEKENKSKEAKCGEGKCGM